MLLIRGIIIAVTTKRQYLSFFQKRFRKRPLKTTNISRISSRKSKNLVFCFDVNSITSWNYVKSACCYDSNVATDEDEWAVLSLNLVVLLLVLTRCTDDDDGTDNDDTDGDDSDDADNIGNNYDGNNYDGDTDDDTYDDCFFILVNKLFEYLFIYLFTYLLF